MDQQDLWYDAPEDALRALCDALEDGKGRRGLKAIGCLLFPGKSPADAGRRLAHCLDPDRDGDKLSIGQLVMLLAMGREQGLHLAMHHLADATGYERPKAVTAEDQLDELRAEFVRAVAQQEQLTRRMEELTRMTVGKRLGAVG